MKHVEIYIITPFPFLSLILNPWQLRSFNLCTPSQSTYTENTDISLINVHTDQENILLKAGNHKAHLPSYLISFVNMSEAHAVSFIY